MGEQQVLLGLVVVVIYIHSVLLRIRSRTLAHHLRSTCIESGSIQLAWQHGLEALLEQHDVLVELPRNILCLVVLILAGLAHATHAVH